MKQKIVIYSTPGSLFKKHHIFQDDADEKSINSFIEAKVMAGMECQLFEKVAVFNLTKQIQEQR